MGYYSSPFIYCGNKYKLLDSIVPLFPKNIDKFLDLFCGSLTVSLNVDAKEIYSNDIVSPMIDCYEAVKTSTIDLNDYYSKLQDELKPYTKEGYIALRNLYNSSNEPLLLLLLIHFSFSNILRFNSKREYNVSFGKTKNVVVKDFNEFRERLKNINLMNKNCFDVKDLSKYDFIYADPPYLITCGTYNDGKRGFEGWNENFEHKLYTMLQESGTKFAISNVVEHQGKTNDILLSYVEKYGWYINEFSFRYHKWAKQKESKLSKEVLITNYKPNINQYSLF